MDYVAIQTADFNLTVEYQHMLDGATSSGAVVLFTGLVRDFNQGDQVMELELEHYPGMAEKALLAIIEKARRHWSLDRIRVIHRVGKLLVSQQIVMVAVSSAHRSDAFSAAVFIMDFLKTEVPIWKKEATDKGGRWVEFNQKELEAKALWQAKGL
ncbi:molybdenum cofactor biosynthesis protein MoaE [Rheinheimera sp. MM224]|uniref:molybdenum cofactor biosynthesis protein MoaE n=1 Tax=Rheinheimera sp. MM224 TaxID=3019969 RepID=UPI0021F876D1|nr:molybdenum cofactor biosynthesis protein MoaE [Rheinheimera sp. MM224]CAI3798357.1 Molybdopterin synthase catalytic subunit [Rheinheimera sp. MM224]